MGSNLSELFNSNYGPSPTHEVSAVEINEDPGWSAHDVKCKVYGFQCVVMRIRLIQGLNTSNIDISWFTIGLTMVFNRGYN